MNSIFDKVNKLDDKDFMPELSNMMDVQVGRLYSKLTLTNSTISTSHNFFTYGLCPDHGLEDTNLEMPACLPPPQTFLVKTIGIVFSPDSEEWDRKTFIRNYAATLWLEQKYYARGSVAEMFTTGNIMDPEFVMKGFLNHNELPLIILTQQMFRGDVSGTPFKLYRPLTMWMVLDGLHARGVQ